MMKIKKIFAVSFIAMAAVSATHATVVTQSNIVGANGVSVTVPTSGTNKGKVQVSGPDLSGKENVLTFTTSGSGNVVTGVSKSGSTVTVNKGTTLATVATSGSYSDLSNKPATLSGTELTGTGTTGRLITGAQYGAKQDVQIGAAGDAGKAVVVDSNGKIGMSSATLKAVATSGSYNDLTNKPTIPAAQVQSDWNATTGMGVIKNKPTLATVATSGSYNDLSNKPTIPAAQVNSDWNATSGKAQILNKPTLGTAAAKNATDTYSAAGTDVVTGKAVASAISGKANSADLATVATSGSYNDLDDKPTIPTVNNKTLTITQGGANAQTFTANSASDVTVDITAAKVGADAAGAAATAKSNIETKLAAGANGYDINAKSLKVNGTAVLTSHQDISGKQNKLNSGTGGNVTITNSNSVTTNGVVKTVTASDGTVTVTRGTVATNDIANSAVGANQLASNAVTTAKITDANVTAPKLADGVVASGSSNVTVTRDSSTKVFKVSVTEQDISGKQDKNTAVTHTASTAAGDASTPVYVASNGAATAISTFGSVASGNAALLKGGTVYTEVRPAQTNGTNGTGYLGAPASTTAAANLTALDTAIKEIHPKDKSVKIPSGSETASNGFASIWVE